MPNHKVVSRDQWLAERKQLLIKEKELTRLRAQVADERMQLPWVKIDKEYIFEGPGSKVSLCDLFDGRHQLIVYHFMFQPDWDEGCKSCSLIADHYEPLIVHLQHRDTSMVTISRAPIEKLEKFRKRMGWRFKWFSSLDTDFNSDFDVYFPGDVREQKEVYYNYRTMPGF